jgi:hypothetical protein
MRNSSSKLLFSLKARSFKSTSTRTVCTSVNHAYRLQKKSFFFSPCTASHELDMTVILMYIFVSYKLLICANNESLNVRPSNKTPTLLYKLTVINLSWQLKPSGYYTYHQFSRSRILGCNHRNIYVSWKYLRKTKLFTYTTSYNWLR